jgi:hypothetical protein
MKTLIITILIAFLTAMGLLSPIRAETVIGSQDTLLGKYEKSDKVFIKLQIENIVSYFHRRTIGEAIVEKDFIRYQFDTNTGELIEKKVKWREDLPDRIDPVIAREQAESMVEGVVQFTELYIISPESDVFLIKPTPENPCWAVRSIDEGRIIITVIDAISGKKLGYGIPPPGAGYSFSGPFDSLVCDGGWVSWYTSARDWFESMGYPTTAEMYPRKPDIQSHLQNDSTAMFYVIAHSKHKTWGFQNWCFEYTTALEIEAWLASYAHMPFTFLANCSGMCDTLDTAAESSLSYAFRKGSNEDAVTVGYCRMDSSICLDCWYFSLEWQDGFFCYLDSGYSMGYAFDHANLDYPVCAIPEWKCLRMAGDRDLIVVPTITRCLCRSILDCYCIEIMAEYYLIHCDFTVPAGQTLNIDPGSELRFMNNSKIAANGTLNANGATGQIRMVSEGNPSKGVELTGQLRIVNGGQIKIYQ